MQYKVSVIIPYYNRQDKIARCFRHLINQSLKEVEYIFVDDGSSDDSTAILKKLIDSSSRKADISVIRQSTNRGVAAARIAGIQSAKGEYLIHCDSDDSFVSNAFELMYLEAKNKCADFVVCDCKIINQDRSVSYFKHRGILFPDRSGALRDTISMATLWSHMVRRDFLLDHNILPHNGINYLEDLLCITQMYGHGACWSYINKNLYEYDRTGEDCITNHPTMEVIMSMRKAVNIMERYNNKWNFGIEDVIVKMKINIRDLMFDAPDFDKRIWMLTYPCVKALQKRQRAGYNRFHYWTYCMAVDYGVTWPYRLISRYISHRRKPEKT